MPKIKILILAMDCTKKLIFSPESGGISKYYSAGMIMHQENLDFTKHCQMPSGAYVQAHNEPTQKNLQHPRTIDCIFLRYVDIMQGWHHLLDLTTVNTMKKEKILCNYQLYRM